MYEFGHSVADLKDWFGRGTRKVEAKEMMDFWKSLSEEEKEDYETAELS
jgi:hypothetical protein